MHRRRDPPARHQPVERGREVREARGTSRLTLLGHYAYAREHETEVATRLPERASIVERHRRATPSHHRSPPAIIPAWCSVEDAQRDHTTGSRPDRLRRDVRSPSGDPRTAQTARPEPVTNTARVAGSASTLERRRNLAVGIRFVNGVEPLWTVPRDYRDATASVSARRSRILSSVHVRAHDWAERARSSSFITCLVTPPPRPQPPPPPVHRQRVGGTPRRAAP